MSPYDYSRRKGSMLTVREAASVLRDLRETKGWSQLELAQRARVSRSFVVDVETGKPTVEAGKLFDLFQALDYEIALRSLSSDEVRW